MQTATRYQTGVEPVHGETVPAVVNHGRWLAKCACGNSEHVKQGEPMTCIVCGAQYTVVFPDPETKIRIDRVLGERPLPENRNWTTESVTDLEFENVEHGLWVS